MLIHLVVFAPSLPWLRQDRGGRCRWEADGLSFRHTRAWLPLLVVGLLAAGLAQAMATPPLLVGVRTVGGGPVSSLFATGAVQVLVFVRTDCPISNAFAPELARLATKYEAGGVTFHPVYLEPAQTTDALRKHGRDFHLPGEALVDGRHELARLCAVRVTPQVAVFCGANRLYTGRIDDRFVTLGRRLPAPTTHELEEAIQDALAGRTPRLAEVPAVGCLLEAQP